MNCSVPVNWHDKQSISSLSFAISLAHSEAELIQIKNKVDGCLAPLRRLKADANVHPLVLELVSAMENRDIGVLSKESDNRGCIPTQ
jgi:hypothetical protein